MAGKVAGGGGSAAAGIGYAAADGVGSAVADGIKLVATDLDGTLLTGYRKDVPPEAWPAIERVCASDVLFLAASGRQYASLRHLFAPVADRMGYVCENGALVMVNDEPLVCRSIDRDLAMGICHAAMELPGCYFLASCERCAYILDDNPALLDRLVNQIHNEMGVVERPEDIPGTIIKVAFFVPGKRHDEVIDYFAQRFGDVCRPVTSGIEWVDMLMDGVNKGTALAGVGRALGIVPERMAAFGDAGNDREMLEFVGHPYLMEPHTPDMDDLAVRCTPCTSVSAELDRILGRR